MSWQQGPYPGQGQQPPPPPGFYPDAGSAYPQPGGYQGYPPGSAGYPTGPSFPQQPGYPSQQPGFPQAAFAKPEMATGYNSGPEYGESAMNMGDFSDKAVRLGFIRKVYGILLVQLCITLAFISLFTFHEGTKLFVYRHQELWWISLITMFVCLIVMACCGDVRRKSPTNFIFLAIFTLCESFLLGCATATFRANEVMLAVGICTVVTLGLTLFAFQTKVDFTMMGGVLFVATLILMVFGFVLMFWNGKVATLIYGSLGALIFSIYIIYDTQMMMGGSHKYSISPEEYIFAALNLYLDIVNLFLYILTIIGASRD